MSFFGIDIPACFACENTSKSLNSAPRSQHITFRNVSFCFQRRRVCCPNHFFFNRNGSTGKGGAKCGVGITFTSTARDELVFSSTAKINSIQSHIHTVTTSPCSAHSRSHHHTVARLFNPSVAPYLSPSVFHSQLCLSLFIALFLLVISFLRKVRASRRES